MTDFDHLFVLPAHQTPMGHLMLKLDFYSGTFQSVLNGCEFLKYHKLHSSGVFQNTSCMVQHVCSIF